MPQQTVTFRVCSSCGGVIPPDAQAVEGVSGRLSLGGGVVQDFSGMDFCSTSHMGLFLKGLPVVPDPSPAYSPPDGNVAPHVEPPPPASMIETMRPAPPEPPTDPATGGKLL